MEKNKGNILDIHTHKSEWNTKGESIINYPLLTDSPLYLSPAKNVNIAVDRGLYFKDWISLLGKEEHMCDKLSDNVFDPKEGYYYSAGIHPWELTALNAKQQLAFLEKEIVKKQFVAVGEAGIDKLAIAPMELQIEVFKEQIKLSEKHALPLIVHCVKAMDELLALKKEYHPVQPWIWHGFRGNPTQAKQLLKKGFYFSFGEYYPDETIKVVPVNRLFIETDNSQTDIEELLLRAANVRGMEVYMLRECICENIEKVFFKG